MINPMHIVCPHCLTTNRVRQEQLRSAPDCGHCKKALFLGRSVATNEAVFEKHLQRNDIPVLVDFWAPWCGPCRMMAPAYEEAARLLEPEFRLVKVDTEAQQNLGAQYAIRSIPTLALFQHGREVARQAGAMSAPDIVRWARAHRA